MSDDLSAPYWAGAEAGRFVIQRCDNCGALRHYPRVMCERCHCFDWTPFDASRDGVVYSWTVCHHVFDATVISDVPYVLVTVAMQDGVRVLGRIAPEVELRAGLSVRLRFEPDAHGRPGPVFVAGTR